MNIAILLALINQAGGLYVKIFTEFVSTHEQRFTAKHYGLHDSLAGKI